MNRRLVREDGSHNRRSEESQALDGDVVQQEDGGNRQRCRRSDTLLDCACVQLVQDDRRANLLSLDSGIRKILLLLRQPLGLLDSIRHQDIGGNTDDGGDNTLDQEDLLPGVHRPNAVDLEDTGSEQSTESPSERCALKESR